MKKYLLCLSLSVAVCMNAMESEFSQDIIQVCEQSAQKDISQNLLSVMQKHSIRLSDAGADGTTILHEAVRSRADTFIEKCVAADANINVQDSEGRTPLFVACGYWDYSEYCACDKEFVDKLIRLGADVNKKNKYLHSPLHHVVEGEASQRSDFESKKEKYPDLEELYKWFGNMKLIATLLICAGADMTCKDNYGKMPYDYASEGMKEILLALQDVSKEELQ